MKDLKINVPTSVKEVKKVAKKTFKTVDEFTTGIAKTIVSIAKKKIQGVK